MIFNRGKHGGHEITEKTLTITTLLQYVCENNGDRRICFEFVIIRNVSVSAFRLFLYMGLRPLYFVFIIYFLSPCAFIV